MVPNTSKLLYLSCTIDSEHHGTVLQILVDARTAISFRPTIYTTRTEPFKGGHPSGVTNGKITIYPGIAG